MKRKKIKKQNPRKQPKPPRKITNPESPWHHYRTIPPKPEAAIDHADEIAIAEQQDADALADEIEQAEADPNAEPEESDEQ